MNKPPKAIIALIVATMVSCTGIDVDYQYGTSFFVTNGSSHKIDIVTLKEAIPSPVPQRLTIESGETAHYYDISIMGGKEYIKIAPYEVNVVFDMDIIIRHTYGDEFNSICNIDNYMFKKIQTGYATLTFTFTDADYEYALENGERLTDQ